MSEPCNCDLARSEPLDHKPGPHHLAACPRWTAEAATRRTPMSDIPDAAVKAAIEARSNHGSDPKPYNHGRCRCGANFATAVEQLEHATRRELEAAFKHLPAGEPAVLRDPYDMDDDERSGR